MKSRMTVNSENNVISPC